jgi:hypothetical protein
MHYEKNPCENILKTIFCIKDTMVVQEDLKDCGIWSHLWVQNVASVYIKPIASCVDKSGKKEISSYYLCFEDANTLCIIEEKSPQGWGLERNEIT